MLFVLFDFQKYKHFVKNMLIFEKYFPQFKKTFFKRFLTAFLTFIR
jgi:hypothetical protein